MVSGDGDAPHAGREANLHPRCPAAPASAAAADGAAPSQDPTRIRCRRGELRRGMPARRRRPDPALARGNPLYQPSHRSPVRSYRLPPACPRARPARIKKPGADCSSRSESGPRRRMKSVARQLTILLDYCCYYYRPSSLRFYLFYVTEV
jgi:hypothetical protein